jgi:hypothetical protein
VLPACPPGLRDHRVLRAPSLVKGLELGCGFFGVRGAVDASEVADEFLAVIPGDVPQRAAEDDARLAPVLGIDGRGRSSRRQRCRQRAHPEATHPANAARPLRPLNETGHPPQVTRPAIALATISRKPPPPVLRTPFCSRKDFADVERRAHGCRPLAPQPPRREGTRGPRRNGVGGPPHRGLHYESAGSGSGGWCC